MEVAVRQAKSDHMKLLCLAAGSSRSSKHVLPEGSILHQDSSMHTHAQIVLTDGVRIMFNRCARDAACTNDRP
jgi:hypothetical protein